MMRQLLFLFALCSSTAFIAVGCCGAAPPVSGTPSSATTSGTTAPTTTATGPLDAPISANCGSGPYAATCGAGQTCCAGGAAGSYYCASLQPGATCPPLP